MKTMKINKIILAALVIGVIAVSCSNDEDVLPKPRGYFRIDLPEKTYAKVDTIERYSFECPDYAHITPEDMERFGVTPVELSNVIDTVREVGGTEVALFLYPVNGKYKISLRSNYIVDVNAIAKEFGGGGHTRAASGDTSDAPEVTIEKILKLIEKQL